MLKTGCTRSVQHCSINRSHFHWYTVQGWTWQQQQQGSVSSSSNSSSSTKCCWCSCGRWQHIPNQVLFYSWRIYLRTCMLISVCCCLLRFRKRSFTSRRQQCPDSNSVRTKQKYFFIIASPSVGWWTYHCAFNRVVMLPSTSESPTMATTRTNNAEQDSIKAPSWCHRVFKSKVTRLVEGRVGRLSKRVATSLCCLLAKQWSRCMR